MTCPYPDKAGRYGLYGGRYVAETLYEPLLKIEAAFEAALLDDAFMACFHGLLRHYVGRETPLYHAQNLSNHLGGPQIYLKREDLNHTGAHKINNAIGQCLLAKSMGFDAVIAETGAGQHGVATATAAALLGLRCDVFMGEADIQRQMTNVQRMRLLGATLHPVPTGTKTLKDATNAAIQHWTCHVDDVFYVIGSAIGPHPYPYMVRHFQSVIGFEVRQQLKAQNLPEPAAMIACVGGGSNAIGFFHPFIETPAIALYAVEAAGKGLTTEHHAATLTKGKTGVLHGTMMKILQGPEGNIHEAFSISAGLDYPGVGPEHCHLSDTGRITALSATDDEALDAFLLLTKLEGILPALESAHAIAGVIQLAHRFSPSDVVVINLSGRGDKDMDTVLKEVLNREQTR